MKYVHSLLAPSRAVHSPPSHAVLSPPNLTAPLRRLYEQGDFPVDRISKTFPVEQFDEAVKAMYVCLLLALVAEGADPNRPTGMMGRSSSL